MLRIFVRAGLALAVMLAVFTPRGTASASSHFSPLPAPLAVSLKLGDQVFNDLNNNGLKESDKSGETGVPNVLVRLLDQDTSGEMSVVGFTRTDAHGKYLFSALAPGVYRVEMVLPPTYLSSQDASTSDTPDNGVDDDDNGVLLLGSVVRSQAVLVGAVDVPETNLTLDFGIWQPASLGDRVWQDSNNDGLQQDAEPGLPDVEVTLFGASDTPIKTTRTDADGRYVFVGLPPGNYAVSVTLPTDHAFSPAGRGDDDRDSDIDPTTGRTAWVSLRPGENNLNLDAGLFPTALQLSIALTAQPRPSQPNDPSSVRPGETITYFIAITNIGHQTVTHIVVTDVVPIGAAYITGSANPTPEASSLPAQLVWAMPALSATHSQTMSFAVRINEGMGNTLTKLRNEATVRSDQTPPNTSHRISHDVVPQTAPGPALSILVLPDVQTITVGSTAVFTVEVTNTGGFDLYGTEVHPTTATDCNHFIGALAVGESVSYTCKRTSVMAAFTDTFTSISFAGRGSLVLSTFTAIVNLKPTARLGDYVWLDEDGDGLQRANAGIPGVQVRLVQVDGVSVTAPFDALANASVITQTTDAHGFFLFDEVLPGRYQMCVSPPIGHSFTRQGRNPDSGVDSNTDPATGCTSVMTATAHVIDTSLDIGLVPVVMRLVQTAQPQPTDGGDSLRINIGDRITYTLGLHNAGLQPAHNILVTDALSIDVQVISGTDQPTATLAAGQLGWRVPELGSGEWFTMSFAVRVMSQQSVSIQNKAFVETTQTPMTASNDVVHVFWPTSVQLLSFGGQWVEREGHTGVNLAWQTGAEVNSFGFALHRSETGDRTDRVRVTPEWIAAKNSTGAIYAFVDETALPNKRYTYWLLETELDGDVIEYEPITVKPLPPVAEAVPAGGVPIAVPVGAVTVPSADAPPVALGALAYDASPQARVSIQVQPVSTQPVASDLSVAAQRLEPQPHSPAVQPNVASAKVAPTQAPIAQPTSMATAPPIPERLPTQLPHVRAAQVVSKPTPPTQLVAPLESPASPLSPLRLLMLLWVLAGLALLISLVGVFLLLRISVRAEGSAPDLARRTRFDIL